MDKYLGIPVMYDLYPGSIADVSTLKNTVKKIEAQGAKNYALIMDRGFFSTDNIDEMVSAASLYHESNPKKEDAAIYPPSGSVLFWTAYPALTRI